jgi:long-chain acyl-CoA synthetase
VPYLSWQEVAAAAQSSLSRVHERRISYLPRRISRSGCSRFYLAISNAAHIYFCHDAATDLMGTMGEVKPTGFFGVPRIFEKVMAGVQALLAAEQDEGKRAAVAAAMATGERYVRSRQCGEITSAELSAEFAAAAEQVLLPIRSLLGLGGAEVVMSGAAPLPPEVGSSSPASA